jgi:hypothetical protein
MAEAARSTALFATDQNGEDTGTDGKEEGNHRFQIFTVNS